MDTFFPISEGHEDTFSGAEAKKYCVNRPEVVGNDFFGSWHLDSYGYYEVNLVPCNMPIPGEEIDPRCNSTLEEQQRFLDQATFRFFHNTGRYDNSKYYEEAISLEGALEDRQFDSTRPNFIKVYLQTT